jgi:DNA topoisomerase-3
MITNRLICAVGEKHRYIESVITLNMNGTEFKSKAKTVIHNGWKAIANAVSDDEDEEETQQLPDITEGQTLQAVASIKEGMTSPPKHHTEDTLLSAMETAGTEDMPDDAERKGLGTPATRAGIIEKIVKSGFAERSKKNIRPTDKAINLIAVLPTSLTSAKMTATWEQKLQLVERGELSGTAFMDGIAAFTKSIMIDNKSPKPEFINLFPSPKKQAVEPIGTCPRCGFFVREAPKGFFCDMNQTCGFKMWKESKFWTAKRKPLTAPIVAALLKDGRVALKGLYSEKKAKTYDATVVLDDTGDNFVNFKLEFDR